MRLPSSSATKRSAEQKADFVSVHKIGQFLKFGLLEGEAWVGGGFMNLVDGDELECAAVLHDALLWAWLCCEVVERTRFPVSAPVGGELGLTAYVLVRVKGFGEALRAKVVVPRRSESLVLFVQLD
jgi:hypothetical protein